MLSVMTLLCDKYARPGFERKTANHFGRLAGDNTCMVRLIATGIRNIDGYISVTREQHLRPTGVGCAWKNGFDSPPACKWLQTEYEGHPRGLSKSEERHAILNGMGYIRGGRGVLRSPLAAGICAARVDQVPISRRASGARCGCHGSTANRQGVELTLSKASGLRLWAKQAAHPSSLLTRLQANALRRHSYTCPPRSTSDAIQGEQARRPRHRRSLHR